MKIILFGTSGMVGQGVLRECLLDQDVEAVLSIVRQPSGSRHGKLRELVHSNFFDFASLESEFRGFDACFFCLGMSAAGKSEAAYSRVTVDITLAAAQTLAKINPSMTFIYVSGMGTDSTERGRSMWARVKGRTENALLRLPFKAFMFRPMAIVPLHGVRSKTLLYQIPYVIFAPLLPWMKAQFPRYFTTSEQVGQAMLKVAKQGAPKRILETADINAIS